MSNKEKKVWILRRSYFISKDGKLVYTNSHYAKHNIHLECTGKLKLDERHDFGIDL